MIGGGAIFAAITKKDLYGVELFMPPDTLIGFFENQACPIDSQIESLHKGIILLTNARDLLLPRLMNGEIAV
jgi:type I restriction enzyme S subunit